MSPIINLQRRLHERGRIRIGEKDAGRGFPKKLDTFRFTSADEQAIIDAAAIWGGKPTPWESPNGSEWQVVTTAKAISVLVPPGDMAFSQWNEAWSGGGCRKRCDGQWDHKRDVACDCDPDPLRQECNPTTRLSVVLPDLPGVGLWRIESHGYYAAVELGATVDLLQSLAPGALVPGRLWMDARSVKREKARGGVETRRFTVPVLDIEGTMRALSAAQPAMEALSAPVDGARGLTPVPVADLPAGPSTPVADQLAAGPRPGAPKRSNAAEPVPATGVKVRRKASGPDGRGVAAGDSRETEQAAGPPAVHERGKEAHDGASEPEAHLPAAASGTPDDDIVDAEILPTPSEGGEVDGGTGVDPMGGTVVPPSTAVDVADLEALMRDRGVGKAAVRREYNRFVQDTGEFDAARWSDLVPGPALDAVYAWVESSGGGGGTDQGPEVAAAASPGAVQKSIHARITGLLLDVDKDRLRHSLVSKATTGRTESSNDLTHDEGLEVHRLLDEIEAGTLKVGKTRANNLYELVTP